MIDIRQANVLDDMQSYPDYYFHTLISDPPYQLGSSWIIDSNGNPQLKESSDFMGKWDAIGGEQWDIFFQEAYRILKHGGYCLLFAIDRQAWVLPYYAVKNGFKVCQSLAWYTMSGFPKGVNASQKINKRLGLEREVIYKNPNSDLAKTFDGYRYSQAPFKPCLESILVLKKPCKHGSVLNDLMAFQGDDEISPAVVNIDGGRVPLAQGEDLSVERDGSPIDTRGQGWGFKRMSRGNEGRVPAQLFIDEECAVLLDSQSGTLKSGDNCIRTKPSNGYHGNIGKAGDVQITYGDSGGCSRALHTCKYEDEEIELIKYCTKVSTSERNAGLDDKVKNHHNTVKPISLICHIMTLFSLPSVCNQKVYIPFAGVFSEVIGTHLAGIKLENITTCEMNPEYIEIGKARLKYWAEKTRQEKEKPMQLKFVH